MHVCPDSWPYLPESNSGRAGFFFAVTGLPEEQKTIDPVLNCEVAVPRTLTFVFKNMSNQAKLLGYGHTPVVLEVNDKEYSDLMEGKSAMYR